MTIVISLSPELEAKLREKAVQQGQNIDLVATQMIEKMLEWELEDSEASIKGIQQGLEDFAAGRFRSFDEFAEEKCRKYNLSANS